MADAVRLISIRRGYDPRDFALVAFGGAGAAARRGAGQGARHSDRARAAAPGITSALGCLLVDIRHDLSAMYLRSVDDADPEEIDAEFGTLEEEGARAAGARGRARGPSCLQRSIAMRYLGQWRSLSVRRRGRSGASPTPIAQFHEEHEREFAYRRDDAPVEIYQLAAARRSA